MSKLKNHIAIVLDRSGSMGVIREETVKAFNAVVAEIARQAKTTKQETSVTFITFANRATVAPCPVPTTKRPGARPCSTA